MPPPLLQTLPSLSEADKTAIADIIEVRIRKLAADGAFVDPLWKNGYNQISKHGIDALSLWVGRKVVTLIIAAAFAATLTWALLFRGGK